MVNLNHPAISSLIISRGLSFRDMSLQDIQESEVSRAEFLYALISKLNCRFLASEKTDGEFKVKYLT